MCRTHYAREWYRGKFAAQPRRRASPEHLVPGTAEYQRWWKANNPEAYARQKRATALRRKEKRTQLRAARPARVVAPRQRNFLNRVLATPKWVNVEELLAVYAESRRRRRAGENVEVDHIVPIRGKLVSGLHVPWNLQIIPKAVNDEKRNKLNEVYDLL
jgi:5-methylcytosine-specific restriction endonuclease McrA